VVVERDRVMRLYASSVVINRHDRKVHELTQARCEGILRGFVEYRGGLEVPAMSNIADVDLVLCVSKKTMQIMHRQYGETALISGDRSV
jgi:hypothetical protein